MLANRVTWAAEIDIIAPVCEKLCAEGLLIRGPLPADTLFTPHYLSEADAVMAMFHDQACQCSNTRASAMR